MPFEARQAHAATPSSVRWRVQLLGGLRVVVGDIPVVKLGGRAAALLLARLVLEPRQAHARDALGEWLWPDMPADVPPSRHQQTRRERLKRVLFNVNAALSPRRADVDEPFIADARTIRLNAELFDSDAARFQRHIRAGERAAAHDSYAGPLLPGFDDPWIEDQRSRLASLHDDLLSVQPGLATAAVLAAPAAAAARRPAASSNGFFGRHADLATVMRTLDEHRAVLVTGAVGCGKTRLCAQLAPALADGWVVHGVRLVECSSADELLGRIREALGLPLDELAVQRQVRARSTQPAASVQIVAHLTARPALLVLENLELIDGAAAFDVLTALQSRLPLLRLLMTSQRVVDRPGWVNVPLLPLPVPSVGDDLADVLRNPAAALFAHRARSVRAGFTIHRRNVGAVINVLRALDGLPALIELAAVRMRDMTPRVLETGLRRSNAVLARKGRSAGSDPRHASPQAMVHCSWQLLSPAQQDGLMRLSVFRGGWTAAQAEAVLAVGDSHALLASLVRDSVVGSCAGDDGAVRFDLLNTIRAEARDRTPPALQLEARRRHRSCFVQAANASGGGSVLGAADVPNIAAAIDSALHDASFDGAAALIAALRPHWTSAGAPEPVMTALRTAVATLPQTDPHWPEVASLSLQLLLAAGHASEAKALARRALLAAADDAGARRASALLDCASVSWMSARDGAATLAAASEAMAIARAANASALLPRALMLMGAATLAKPGGARQAKAYFHAARRLFEAAGDAAGQLRALAGFSACQIDEGHFAAAIKSSRIGARLADDLHDLPLKLQFCSRLSTSHEALGDFRRAVDICRDQTRIAQRHGLSYHVAYGVWNQCMPLARLGQFELAGRLMAFAAAYWTARFDPLTKDDRRDINAVKALVAKELGGKRCKTLQAQGALLPADEGVALSMESPHSEHVITKKGRSRDAPA